MDKELYILEALYNTRLVDVPRYVLDLDPQMFSSRNRKMFEALLTGERDFIKLSKATGWNPSGIVDLNTPDKWDKILSVDLIREFKEEKLMVKATEAFGNKDWNKLNEISFNIQNNVIGKPSEEYKKFKEEFKDIANKGQLGPSTGIPGLDEITKGIIPGHIWVCGAYYGQGKTYMAINMINSLLDQGKRVMFISLEMPDEEIIQRFIALRAGISLMETLSDVDEYKKAKRDAAEKFLFDKLDSGQLILDPNSRNISAVVSNILIENKKEHIDGVFLDYIQLIANPSKQYESISEAVQLLQGIAKKIKTTIIMLSQINNASQKEGDSRMVDGFKGAGDIGQVANVAIRIERNRNPDTGEYSNYFGIRVTKIRYGKPTKIDCIIDFPSGKIRKPMEGEITIAEKKMTKKEAFIASAFEGLAEPIAD